MIIFCFNLIVCFAHTNLLKLCRNCLFTLVFEHLNPIIKLIFIHNIVYKCFMHVCVCVTEFYDMWNEQIIRWWDSNISQWLIQPEAPSRIVMYPSFKTSTYSFPAYLVTPSPYSPPPPIIPPCCDHHFRHTGSSTHLVVLRLYHHIYSLPLA